MANDSTWIDSVRTFFVEMVPSSFLAAASATNDQELGAALVASANFRRSNADNARIAAVSARLRKEGRTTAAKVLTVLGYLPDAARFAEIERCPLDRRDQIARHTFDACRNALEISRGLGFDEVSALLARTMGQGLGQLGPREIGGALERLREASELYRKIVASDARYERHLAGTLSDLALTLAGRGDFLEARSACQEAVALLDELVKQKRSKCLPDFGMALNTMGIILWKLRLLPEAAKVLGQAHGIRRKLAAEQPSIVNETDLAMTLANRASVYHEQGASEDAATDLREALTRYSLPNVAKSRAFLPQTAAALNNLGNVLRDLGNYRNDPNLRSEAVKILRKALANRLRLLRTQREKYLGQVATTMNNLANALRSAGSFHAAKPYMEKALSHRRELATRQPQIYQFYVASTLTNLALLNRDIGESEEAVRRDLEAIREAEEADSRSDGQTHAKRPVEASYRYSISAAVSRQDYHIMMRYLAATREEKCFATLGQEPREPAGVQGALAAIDERTGRLSCLLIVQDLPGETLFVVVDKERFEIECQSHKQEEWPPQISALVEKYNNWLEQSAILGRLQEKHTRKGSGRRSSSRYTGPVRDTLEIMVRKAEDIRNHAGPAFASLPDIVRRVLGTTESDVLLSTAGTYDDFPFEILRFGNSPTEFVGLQSVLTRVRGISPVALKKLSIGFSQIKEIRAVVAADPADNLPRARVEARALVARLKRLGYQIVPKGDELVGQDLSVESFLNSLRCGPSIVHYAGHGAIPKSPISADDTKYEVNEELLMLSDGPFGASSLRKSDVTFESSPLVVLNSCRTGRSRIRGGVRDDLVSTFLARGAAAVVASAFPIYDDVGKAFSDKFYEHCFDDQVGVGFRAAVSFCETCCRREGESDLLWRAMWPSWALLWLYGTPYLRVPRGTCLPDRTDKR